MRGWFMRVIGVSVAGLLSASAASGQATAPVAQPVAPPIAPPVATPAISPATSQNSVDVTTPQGALKSLSRALDAGDRELVLKMLSAQSPAEEKFAAATAELAQATAGLRKAALKMFGETGSSALGVDAQATAEAMKRIDGAKIELESDKATLRATGESEGPPMVVVKGHDGQWRVPVSELSKDVEAADVEKNLRDAAEQTRSLREITADVLAGKFKSATEAREALDQKILKATMPDVGGSAVEAATKP